MLSVIAKGFFSSSPVLIFPILALLLFLFIFTVITIRVLATDRETIHKLTVLPLVDEIPQTAHTKTRGLQ